MTHLIPLSPSGITPETSRPDPARVIAGDPVQTTWILDAQDRLCAGLWHSTPGQWRVSYQEWEYIRIREGLSILTDENGTETQLAAGDSLIIRPGFSGTWTCIEPTLKDFVIYE
jgi:uncharacterized cupin superfamily protein